MERWIVVEHGLHLENRSATRTEELQQRIAPVLGTQGPAHARLDFRNTAWSFQRSVARHSLPPHHVH